MKPWVVLFISLLPLLAHAQINPPEDFGVDESQCLIPTQPPNIVDFWFDKSIAFKTAKECFENLAAVVLVGRAFSPIPVITQRGQAFDVLYRTRDRKTSVRCQLIPHFDQLPEVDAEVIALIPNLPASLPEVRRWLGPRVNQLELSCPDLSV